MAMKIQTHSQHETSRTLTAMEIQTLSRSKRVTLTAMEIQSPNQLETATTFTAMAIQNLETTTLTAMEIQNPNQRDPAEGADNIADVVP
jgi:hypothetical protein